MRRVKGSYVVEATMALPIFMIVFVAIIFGIRLIKLQGTANMAGVYSLELVNRGSQIINAITLEAEEGTIPTEEQIQTFYNLVAYAEIDHLSEKEKKFLESLPKMNKAGIKLLLKGVMTETLYTTLNNYVKQQFLGDTEKIFSIDVPTFEITDNKDGRRVDCDIAYSLKTPLTFLGNGVATREFNMCAYIE